MRFKDKYTNPKEKDIKKDELSMDAYAIGELLEEIKDSLNNARFNR